MFKVIFKIITDLDGKDLEYPGTFDLRCPESRSMGEVYNTAIGYSFRICKKTNETLKKLVMQVEDLGLGVNDTLTISYDFAKELSKIAREFHND